MENELTLLFDSPLATLEKVGGKGANLARLSGAGFPVPTGFLITTAAYRAFVEANRLEPPITARLNGLQADDPAALREASDDIRARFESGEIPAVLAAAIATAYRPLGNRPVAVRSSATAEDLPDFSFAGQQDTYLNIIGEEALLKAVRACWGSLWTARAIGYRARNHIPHEQVSLSVVVQELVPSRASGVLFTANPLSGHRRQTVIDATLGLGEALVGGHVEPDHFVVDSTSGRIISRSLGKKSLALLPDPAGGLVKHEDPAAAGQPSISDEQIVALDDLGRRVEQLYGTPQDIEWAVADDHIYLLQSRPITSLFPVPEARDEGYLRIYFSFGSVQGVLGPITPLGQDAIRILFAGMSSIFNVRSTHHSQQSVLAAGERLWMNMTGFLRHPIGFRLVSRLIYGVDPGVYETLQKLRRDSTLEFGRGRIRFSTVRKVLRFGRLMGHYARLAWKNPEGRAAEIERLSHLEVARVAALGQGIGRGRGRPTGFAAYFHHLFNGFPYAVPKVAAGALPGLLSFLALTRLAGQLGLSPDVPLEISRGLPNNVTTAMDLELWRTAQAIGQDIPSRDLFANQAAADIFDLFVSNELPPAAQAALGAFLERYGMRGLGEIDFGRPRWRENPLPIIQTLQSYLKIEDPDLAPDAVFKRGEQAAGAAVEQILQAARKSFLGGFKARLIRALVRRARGLSGLRESPKFHLIRLMGVIRARLLEVGAALAAAGEIERADDLFFLTYDELIALDRGEGRPWRQIVAGRRELYEREQGRKQIPRLLLSDGRAFYDGVAAVTDGSGDLAGSPVSPGVVEGRVRVVFDPHDANLQPGEILVCEGTDPAWTPLFLAAGGLVMEVGGLMTHGAIVAREYGIPAVVGVDRATARLQTGQRIRVDGSRGRVSFLEENGFGGQQEVS